MLSRSITGATNSAPEAAALEAPIVDDETWTTGEFEIVSSDNVRFRVPIYHVLSASAVLRDAHGVDSAARSVTMTDETIETATTLRQFLELAVYGELSSPTFLEVEPEPNLALIKALVNFTLKWDAERVRKAFWHIFELNLRTRWTLSDTLFFAAAQYDQERLCRIAIEVFAGNAWEGEEGKSAAWNGTGRQNIWNVNHWPGQWWMEVPPKYLFVVSRAYESAAARAGGVQKHLGTEFDRFLKVWKDNAQ